MTLDVTEPRAKKKVSIVLPPASIRTKERRDRARTFSVKSLSTNSESECDVNNCRLERIELRKLRYSALLGLPAGFTLEADPYRIATHHAHTLKFHRENKSVNRHFQKLSMNNAVPILSFRIAVFCLVLNIVFPGLGTLTAAFSCLIFPHNSLMKEKRFSFFGWNILIGLSQIVGILYLLIGYFWGIIWGVYMVQISDRAAEGSNTPTLGAKVAASFRSSSFWKRQQKTDTIDKDVIENLTLEEV